MQDCGLIKLCSPQMGDQQFFNWGIKIYEELRIIFSLIV
jgi:hypothetical protein